MSIIGLRNFLTAPVSNPRDVRVRFWLSLSLILAGVYCFLAVKEVFGSQYIIHDDVRSHVFWMRRFFDPELFPNDIIADYFQSVAPYGYTALYRLMAALGTDPVFFNKLLPIALTVIVTVYCFGTCLRIFPVPAAAFIATLFLSQNIWVTHDVASGTPRAFFYPLFLAFLYYLLRRALVPVLVAIALQGLFYPQCLFLSAGILVLRLLRVRNWRVRLSGNRNDYLFCIAGLGVVGLMLLPYALKVSEFGPVTTAAQGRSLPILQSTGRKNFFYDNPWKFWFCSERSGMIPYDWCKYFPPPQAWLALGLPFILKFRRRFPLTKKADTAILMQILVASLGMFFAAHALLFKLHLPSRYTKHSLRILVALAAGVVLIMILDVLLRACERAKSKSKRDRQLLTVGVLTPFVVVLFGYPFLLEEYPKPDYVEAEVPALYEFFAQQPQDTLIASLADRANNIPTLSQRSVLVSSEIANPYHLGYYRMIQQRTADLMLAQYSQDLQAAKQLIEKYGVDFFLVEAGAFTPEYIEDSDWLREVALAPEAIARLKQGELPALAGLLDRCSVLKVEDLVVLQAECVASIALHR